MGVRWLLVACWLLCQPGVAAEVWLLDGSQVTADEISMTATDVVVADRRVPLAAIDRLRLPGETADSVTIDEDGLVAVLADGSWVPLRAEPRVTAPDRLTLIGPVGTWELDLGLVLAWGPYRWVAQTLADHNDTDHLLLPDTSVTGQVQGADTAGYRMIGSLGEIVLPSERVAGMFLALPMTLPSGPHLTLTTRLGLPPMVVAPSPDGLQLAAAPVSVRAPGAWLRVEGGRRVYLSALTPSDVDEQGHFGVTWPHSINRDLDANPIVLGGQRAEHGLVVHSDARLVFALAGAFERLQGRVGIVDAVHPEGDCLVTIRLDGRAVWDGQRVRAGEPIAELDLPLAGVDQLEIVIEAGERYDIGDHVAFADAWLVRIED